MMARSPRRRVIPLFVLSALVLVLGIAVAVTFTNSTTWSALRLRLTGVYPVPSLGMTFDRDLKVIGLVPGGAAESEGVKEGDGIIAVNREPVRDADRVYQILQNAETGGSLRLGLVRHNNKLDVILQVVPATPAEGAP